MAGGSAAIALGFLTAVDHPQHGVIGGYLLLNALGRPLEFHCTAPIKPNRVQEILYGPTLQPYLYGEQIGHALVTKSGVQPLAVCTDSQSMLAVRPHIAPPVAWVIAEEKPADAIERGTLPQRAALRIDGPHSSLKPAGVIGRYHVAVADTHPQDYPAIAERLETLAAAMDLLEPFERIREAIDEAGRVGR